MLRRILSLFLLTLVVTTPSVILATRHSRGEEIFAAEEKRLLDDQTPKHLPIKLKLRSEKEKGFNDLKNENWLRDFELEVTNTSNKPIYFLAIWVVLPEMVNPSGHPDGFSPRYGRIEFIDFGTPTTPTDIPIQPGATHIFKIEEKYQRGWKAHKIRENKPTPKKVEIKFVQLNFGDGTGYTGTDGMPYPYK